MARLLIDKGYHRVRPLAGGFEAWLAAGLPFDSAPLITIQPAGDRGVPGS